MPLLSVSRPLTAHPYGNPGGPLRMCPQDPSDEMSVQEAINERVDGEA